MTDLEMIHLKGAVRRAHRAMTTGVPDSGCYYSEDLRKFFKKQEVLSEPTPGKLHWLSFYGFTKLGRDIYLNEDGSIRDEYK